MYRRGQSVIFSERYIAGLVGWHLSQTQRVLGRVMKVDHLFIRKPTVHRKGVRNMRRGSPILIQRDHL